MNNFIQSFYKYYFCELEAVTIQYDYELASLGFLFLIIYTIINFLEFFMPYYALDISPVYVIQSLYIDMSLWDSNPIFFVENSNNINRIIYITYRELMFIIISNPVTFNFLLGINPLDLSYNELKPIVKIYIDAVNANVTELYKYYTVLFPDYITIIQFNDLLYNYFIFKNNDLFSLHINLISDFNKSIYHVEYPKLMEMVLNSPNNIDINREVIDYHYKRSSSVLDDIYYRIITEKITCLSCEWLGVISFIGIHIFSHFFLITS